MKNEKDKIDWLKIIGLTIAAFAAFYGYKKVSSSYDIANKSGKFSKAETHLTIDGFSTSYSESRGIPIHIIYGIKNKDFYPVYTELPFYVTNNGDKTSEDVHMLINFKNPLRGLEEEGVFFENPISRDSKRSYTKFENLSRVVYEIGEIAPEYELGIPEGVFLPPEGNFSSISYDFRVGLTSKDSKTKDYAFSLGCHLASSPKELAIEQLRKIRNKNKVDLPEILEFYFILPQSFYTSNLIDKITGDTIPAYISSASSEIIHIGVYNSNRDELKLYDGKGKYYETLE